MFNILSLLCVLQIKVSRLVLMDDVPPAQARTAQMTGTPSSLSLPLLESKDEHKLLLSMESRLPVIADTCWSSLS